MIQRRKKWNKHIWGKERRTENRKIQYCSSLKENKFLLAKPSCSFLPWWLLSAVLPRCFDWERSVDIIKCIFILITFISFLHASSQIKKKKWSSLFFPWSTAHFLLMWACKRFSEKSEAELPYVLLGRPGHVDGGLQDCILQFHFKWDLSTRKYKIVNLG